MEAIDTLVHTYQLKYQWGEQKLENEFDALYIKYVTQRKEEIVDALAISPLLESLLNGDEIDIESMPDHVKHAFEDAFPKIPIETINERSPEAIEYLVNAWKGKLFEVEVQDQLNAGI